MCLVTKESTEVKKRDLWVYEIKITAGRKGRTGQDETSSHG